MAIEKSIELKDVGVAAVYHRINGYDICHVPEHDVEGSKGSVFVRIASYTSKAVRDAGGNPVATFDVRLRFGAGIQPVMTDEKPVAVIPVDEPTRSDVYAALDQVPLFEGGAAA